MRGSDVASASVPACAWQDIATAPMDGTIIILFVGWAAAGCFAPDDCTDRYPWKFFDTDRDVPFINGAENATRHAPTHWMPLPPPPVSSGQNLADATQKSSAMPKEGSGK